VIGVPEERSLEEYLKKIIERLDNQERLIRDLEERLSRIEGRTARVGEPASIQPSLLRVLRALLDTERPLGTGEVARRLSLSRHLTSSYLNRLSELGYVVKEPNLEGKSPRYLFRVNLEALPDSLKKMLLNRREQVK